MGAVMGASLFIAAYLVHVLALYFVYWPSLLFERRYKPLAKALTIEDALGHKLVDDRKRAAAAPRSALLEYDETKSTLMETDKPKSAVLKADMLKYSFLETYKQKSTVLETYKPKSTVLEIEQMESAILESGKPNFALGTHRSAQLQTAPSERDRPAGSNVGHAQARSSIREDSTAASVPVPKSTRSHLLEPKD